MNQYPPNHTQNVISGRKKPTLGHAATNQPVYRIASGRSEFCACSKHLANNLCHTKWPVYLDGRTVESESTLFVQLRIVTLHL